VARVTVGERALADLDQMIETHHLPADTRERMLQRLDQLETFPLSGSLLAGRWSGLRFISGPWSWMLLIYRYDEADDLVTVAVIQDGRTSTAATAER
jgi:hypothetical protein